MIVDNNGGQVRAVELFFLVDQRGVWNQCAYQLGTAIVTALNGACFGSGLSGPSANRIMESIQRMRSDVIEVTTLSSAAPAKT